MPRTPAPGCVSELIPEAMDSVALVAPRPQEELSLGPQKISVPTLTSPLPAPGSCELLCSWPWTEILDKEDNVNGTKQTWGLSNIIDAIRN